MLSDSLEEKYKNERYLQSYKMSNNFVTEPSLDNGGTKNVNINNQFFKISEHISELDFLSTTQTPISNGVGKNINLFTSASSNTKNDNFSTINYTADRNI